MKRLALIVALSAIANVVPFSQANARDDDSCERRVHLETTSPVVLPEGAGCDLTGMVAHVGSVALTIPARGEGVGFSGGPKEVSLTHFSNGAIEVIEDGGLLHRTEGHEFDGFSSNGIAPAPGCATSTAYVRHGSKWYNSYGWRYNPAGEAPLMATPPLSSVQAAAAGLVNGYNDCGETGVPATALQHYVGSTADRPNNLLSGGCGARDQKNTVGWGDITNATTLASACRYWSTGTTPWTTVEGDVVFDTGHSWYKGGSCVPNELYRPFDLQGTATHEFGHIFGLQHVPESGASAALTMSEAGYPCSFEDRTLGKGDLAGLFAIYGKL